ncbi:MAG: glutamyl-tRNA reductase [Elusimicrobiota bacterium]|nr:MAG: glutamyl-tRNA reductase [Elusimicrobiota bacterium]
MKLVSLSWSHRARASAAREALAAVPVERVLAELKARGVGEAAALSTCNRFELYAVGAGHAGALVGALEEIAGSALREHVETREDESAVGHLFAVAAGLDSIVVGETEILGQVKTGYESAKSLGMTGKRLNVLFQRALYVGKKVRTETSIAAGSASVPSVAVQLAESIFGSLEGKSALILGAGAMAELAAKHLAARGASRLSVANRTWERAYQLAARYQGEAVRWEDFPRELERADVVIASTGAPKAVLTRAVVEDAARRRGGRSLFMIDIAMPRDVEDSVNELDGVYLYRLEDLEAIVAKNMASRAECVAAARRVVDAKAAEFGAWARSLAEGRELSLKHSAAPR